MNTRETQRGAIGLILILVAGALLVTGTAAYYGMGMDEPENREAVREAVTAEVNDDDDMSQDDDMMNEDVDNTASTSVDSEVAFTLKMQDLSAEQRAFLAMRGVEGDEVEVTNGMVDCAEAKLGIERVMEIRNGAALSMTEKVQLLACY